MPGKFLQSEEKRLLAVYPCPHSLPYQAVSLWSSLPPEPQYFILEVPTLPQGGGGGRPGEPRGVASGPHPHPHSQYGIVLDAGSSHTSMFIYKWPADKENDTGIVGQHSSCNVRGKAPCA